MTKNSLNIIALIISIASLLPRAGAAQTDDPPKNVYIAASIPDSLKEGSNTVVRYSYDEANISNPGKAIIKHHKIITILNEKGDREAITQLFYNKKYDTYTDITVRTFGPDGTQLRKFHKTDMYDGAAIDEATMVNDERFLGLKVDVVSYPETVDVAYEEDLSSYINPATWDIQHDQQGIEYELYKVRVKPELGFRYLAKNISLKPSVNSDSGPDVYTWEIKGLKAVKAEEGAESWAVFPFVMFAVNNFDCYGYKGSMSTWKDFGSWIYGLNSDVCTLTPQRAAEIQKMTDTIKNDKAKAKFLYEYMQKNMRYVSVQLGIGGYKPFSADFVDQKKYGDCKALSNYMYALLKAVNIKSYWALIRAGDNESSAEPSFPNNSFNHEILCIPFKNDTTWLECTSSTQPFGKLGPFTENRNALLITEDGGKLANTPKSIAADNQFNSEVHLTLDSTGGAKATIKILSTGGYREMYIELAEIKQDEQKEFLLKTLNIKQPSKFDFQTEDDKTGTKQLELSLQYDRFYDIANGGKQFYHPNAIDICNFTLPEEEKRKSDYYFEHPLQKSCVTTIDLPAGFEVETLPANQQLKFSYGSFVLNYKYDAAKNQVTSTATFTILNHVIPSAKYTELQQYLDAVKKAENKKLVIRRKV